MPTVGEVIRRILPHGTNPAPPDEPALLDWRAPPLWPPDLFAVTATLAALSGAYAHAAVTFGTRESAREAADWVARVEELGAVWRLLDAERMPEAMARVQALWTALLDASAQPISEHPGPGASPWCAAALELMAIADEASAGIGFDIASPIFSAKVAERHFSAMVANWRSGPSSAEETPLRADRTTATLCLLVPPEECCVQPKARTPQVGCTPRSLTHHLALLPPLGEVTTSYLLSPKPATGDALHLLLVPYPFAMSAGAFEATELHEDEGWGRFRIRQDWFPAGDPESSGRQLAAFLGELVAEARAKGGAVHAVVLPELALDAERAMVVGQELAKAGIHLFVSGVLTPGPDGHPPRNDVMSVLYQDEAVLTYWEQSKHHRWRLERGQIEAYGLPLDPAHLWWEDADVSARHVRFYGFHEGATLATLVCEDLARIDPVQPVLRAVGPNLVIALLMDGPQMSFRWPARYATVLAEDPGSTVLTITSAGLVDRHIAQTNAAKRPPLARAIGLWKDASSSTKQLVLDPGSHALLLRASLVWVEERTMDRRSDGEATREVRWGDVLQVAHPAPPDWLTPIAGLTSVE